MAHTQPGMAERNLCSKRKFCGKFADDWDREVRYCGEGSRLRRDSDMDESVTPFKPAACGQARDPFDSSRSGIDYAETVNGNDLLWVE